MFRPSFETLEKREVFSAGSLSGPQPLSISGQGSDDPIPTESISFNFAAPTVPTTASPARAWDGDYGFDGVGISASVTRAVDTRSNSTSTGLHALAGTAFGVDFNPVPDRVTQASAGGGGPSNFLLPYLEQDNLYRSFSGTVLDDQACVGNLYGDLLGRQPTAARDAVFGELGTRGILLDPEARGNAIDGTSNTIMFGESLRVPASANEEVQSSALVATTYGRGSFFSSSLDEPQSSLLIGSPEYRQIAGASGGVWKTTNVDRGYISPY